MAFASVHRNALIRPRLMSEVFTVSRKIWGPVIPLSLVERMRNERESARTRPSSREEEPPIIERRDEREMGIIVGRSVRRVIPVCSPESMSQAGKRMSYHIQSESDSSASQTCLLYGKFHGLIMVHESMSTSG